MKYLFLLLVLFSACGFKKTNEIVVDQYLLAEVNNKIDSLKSHLPLCEYPNGLIGVAKQNCDDGDVMLWSGLLCLSGNQVGCSTAKASFNSEGRPFRSPGRVHAFQDEFSRVKRV